MHETPAVCDVADATVAVTVVGQFVVHALQTHVSEIRHRCYSGDIAKSCLQAAHADRDVGRELCGGPGVLRTRLEHLDSSADRASTRSCLGREELIRIVVPMPDQQSVDEELLEPASDEIMVQKSTFHPRLLLDQAEGLQPAMPGWDP
jgi:hypothetical protein